MDRSLYIAMSGAKQTLLAKAANANNLANSQTIGFKSDFAQFRAMPMFGPGHPTRVYAMTERPGHNFVSGAIRTTGRDLDVAIQDKGWLAVQGLNGQEAYVRAGSLVRTTSGQLQTAFGLPVLGNKGPIAIPPANSISIGKDGTISIIPIAGRKNSPAIIDRIKLVKPSIDNLEKKADGLFYLKNGAQSPASANVTLVQGALEDSNVNPIHSMVEMIQLARNFELQTKMMKQTSDNAAASTKLLQLA